MRESVKPFAARNGACRLAVDGFEGAIASPQAKTRQVLCHSSDVFRYAHTVVVEDYDERLAARVENSVYGDCYLRHAEGA